MNRSPVQFRPAALVWSGSYGDYFFKSFISGFDLSKQVSSRAHGEKDTLGDILIVSPYCTVILKAMLTRVVVDSVGALIFMRDVLIPP